MYVATHAPFTVKNLFMHFAHFAIELQNYEHIELYSYEFVGAFYIPKHNPYVSFIL